MPKETKPLIAPIQAILLKKGRCVACLTPLKEGIHVPLSEDKEEVTCQCRRIYIYTKTTDSYIRAPLDQVN